MCEDSDQASVHGTQTQDVACWHMAHTGTACVYHMAQ